MKIKRVGFTEGTLLFIRWLTKISNIILTDQELNDLNIIRNKMINWLHSTSGFYNKKVKGRYFDINLDTYDHEYLEKYLYLLSNSILESNNFNICTHEYVIKSLTYKEQFLNYYNSNKIVCINENLTYNFMKNKKILIISSFGKLMKEQYDSGNVFKFNPAFPNIESITYYTSPYTFFNSGPDENSIETCEKIYNEIINISNFNEIDSIIISFGSYSNVLSLYFEKNYNKDILTIGRLLASIFGIIAHNAPIPEKFTEYYITKIPDEYKPDNYDKIENGCYW